MKNKTVDLSKKRVTDLKINKRVMLTDPRPAGEEATLLVRRGRLIEVAKKYISKRCDKKGEVIESNLSEQERRGLKKLKERAKSGKVVIRPTDKSHKLCISTMENYREPGRPHTEGGRPQGQQTAHH